MCDNKIRLDKKESPYCSEKLLKANMASVPGLLEHTKAKGIDICGSDSSIYIIRSDLGCYMRIDVYGLDKPQKLNIFPLNPYCAGGDHYANDGKLFYIIRDNSFIKVNDLSFPIDNSSSPQSLHQSCQNGDHYLYTNGSFFIINEKSNTYIAVSDLSTGETSEPPGTIYEGNRGIYYYGMPTTSGLKFGVVHQANNWGVPFSMLESLTQGGDDRIMLPDIINFFPGGLSTTFGPTESSWKPVQSFTNKSKAELTWSKSITKTVGYNRSRFQSMENSWSVSSTVSMGTKFEAGIDDLCKASVETQFSLSASAGGKSVRSDQEDWNEQYTTEEKVELAIPPGGSVYVWQFTLGLKGTGDVLHCRDLQLTDSADPPQDIPLPPV